MEMTVMTLNLVEKQPAAMRRIIGKHLAVPRWQDTCDYYNQMMERERLTVCFHAQLKQRHATMRFEEMNDVERERLVHVQLMNCVAHSQNAVRSAQVSMHILVF
ncbi:hypothetical protein EIMP300_05910 [Escherichia coli]|uniref:Replication protein n=1 Tax=Escherichia coli TaxID=562 RepID=A0A8S0FF54_ECOLX|nr:hypothetical protein EIMP300_05910 [Escherichia coli]